ncbi:MAG: DUF4382 domain-containing protein [Balneolaceae bacterium]|nr:DUF4382 domain-containing protein [Balneolaceae bacterium]
MPLFVTALLLTIISGCGVNSSDDAEGTLNIRLTDDPATYQAVYIDIQRVELNRGTEEQPQWQTIRSQPIRLDLLKLNNGADTLLASFQIETGTYNQLRFLLGDNNEVIVNGESNSLSVPSGTESGFKVNLNATVSEDVPVTKIIDFDVARSIAVTGNGQYLLNPVLSVFDPETSGSISGQMVPQGVPALVSAVIGDQIIATTYIENDGTFLLSGLEENFYNVRIEPNSTQYADTTIFETEVENAQTTDLGIIQFPEE